MKKIIIALLTLAVLIISGCKEDITGGAVVCNKPYILVGGDCCLDKDDNSICDKDEIEETEPDPVEPPKEEIEEEQTIEEVEEIIEEIPEEEPTAEEDKTSNEFLIKLGESVEFDGKKVTLIELDNIPLFKAVFNIDGIERDIYGTKNLEIIKGIEVKIMKYNNKENSVVVSLEKLELGDNNLITPREDLTIYGKLITLKDVLDSGEILLDVMDIGTEEITMKILLKEGESENVQGLTITNIDGFPRGFKIEEYAIINIQK